MEITHTGWEWERIADFLRENFPYELAAEELAQFIDDVLEEGFVRGDEQLPMLFINQDDIDYVQSVGG